ncbi:unnamed protein product [Nyctereutes procyonoides]|uniref:Translationally-controlled tumor protein n=1 Tax=Nyctereutes procyonoides TaxID=34880 RepID=A0A811YUU7_NYCPR|nr:unnamed protein product [Nyctereutes procyonoides]
MIIYLDLISHNEMFSGIYKILEVVSELCLEVKGKIVSRTEDPQGKSSESTVIIGVDIVKNHYLQKTNFTNEAYKKFIVDCCRQIKHVFPNFKNYQFFIGENMNPDGIVALLDYHEDGLTLYIIFFKNGLEMKKCQ